MVESFDIKEKEGKILPARKPTPSKIAIIDDGVMLVTNSKKYTLHDQASRQIVEGKSFVSQEREEYQWFLPDGGGHGTQYAHCVRRSINMLTILFEEWHRSYQVLTQNVRCTWLKFEVHELG